jgi:septin family protein
MFVDDLLYLIKENGITRTLDSIDIEGLEDASDENDTIKIICRTIKYSCDQLDRVLLDRIASRDASRQ